MAEITQGSPLPNITTTQQQITAAPNWYTDYLSNLAQQGKDATQQAQFVGASPLQQQAFNLTGQQTGAYSPTLQQAINLAGQTGMPSAVSASSPYFQAATGSTGLGAAQPYLTAGTGTSGMQAASPYFQAATAGTGLNVAQPYLTAGTGISGSQAASPYLQAASQLAPSNVAQYLNPFTQSVVSEIGRLGQEQITRNLSPQATAAAVGSGQFGSRRGAEILGETINRALENMRGQQLGALQTGYQNALTASQTDLARQLATGQTAGQLANQQAANLLQAAQLSGGLSQADLNRQLATGQTAGQLTNQQAANLLQAAQLSGGLNQADLARQLSTGQAAGQMAASDAMQRLQSSQMLGNLAQAGQGLNLADINALSTLGAQQQQIGLAEQLFPLQVAAQQAGLLRGYTIPTSVASTYTGPIPGAYNASPLQQIAGITSLLGALTTPQQGSSTSPLQNIISGIGGLFPSSGGGGGTTAYPVDDIFGNIIYGPGGSYTTSGGSVINPSDYSDLV